MLKHAILAALLFSLLSTIGQAQTPSLRFDNEFVIDTSPAVPNDVISEQLTATTVQSEEGIAYTDDTVTGDCGCQTSTGCSQGCAQHNRRSWRDTCLYYRSVRQSFDRGPCCGEYFGGFGPLWESYCDDRLLGCGSLFSLGSCGQGRLRPHCGICRGRGCAHCDACCDVAPTYGPIEVDEGTITEPAPADVGPTPEPAPEPAPTQAAEPAASPMPQLELPVSLQSQTSSRRGWLRGGLPWKN